MTQHIGIQHIGTQNIATHEVAPSPAVPLPDGDPVSCWDRLTVRSVGIGAAGLLVIALAILGGLGLAGVGPLRLSGSNDKPGSLALSDTPPVEFAYLDGLRAGSYLGQMEGGLSTSEQRTDASTRTLSGNLAVGTAATFGGSQQMQHSTQTTITLGAAEHFYIFLQSLLREKEAEYLSKTCGERHWLGDVDDQLSLRKIMLEVKCIGVGGFVRIRNAQLFLPPFAQALPRAQSTNAFFGALPAPRVPFTSPTQSEKLNRALHLYAKEVGTHVRMPFVAAPYGDKNEIGDDKKGGGVPIFLPALYRGLTLEPSLLSGSVTIVGEIVYYAEAGPPYIDYPTVSQFGRALLSKQATALGLDLGVCSRKPPSAVRAKAVKSAKGSANKASQVAQNGVAARRVVHSAKASCASRQIMLYEVKRAVTFKPPFIVVLPIAIYE